MQDRPIPSLKKEVKVLSAPTGQLHTKTISIEEMKRQQQEQPAVSVEDFSNRPRNSFTHDDLIMAWRQFAFKIREERLGGADSMSLALTKRDPKLDGTHIHAEFDNTIIVEMLQRDFYAPLMDYLRNKLKNWSVTFDYSVAQNSEENNKYLTSKDKFDILARKNVNLITLQKTFNLDLDY